MVAPITGPFSETFTLSKTRSNGTVAVHDYFFKNTYRQRKPFTEPLYCKRIRQKGVLEYRVHPYPWENYSYDSFSYGSGQPTQADLVSWRAEVYNKAYERFRNKVKDTASWAVTLAERKQAIGMMTSRLVQLGRFARAVKKGRIHEAAEALGVRNHPRYKRFDPRREAKDAGKLWTEFWFGWSPLVSDIYGTMDILQKPFPYHTVKASARADTTTSSSSTSFGWRYTNARSWDVRVRIQADVEVSNPNLFLANQLGLVNPAVVALELVPYSWLAGWFVNLEAILSSWTDFVGLALSRQQVSYRYSYSLTHTEVLLAGGQAYGWKTLGEEYERNPGSIPGPTLTLSIPDRLSVTRALTACSLLVQHLK